MDEFKITEEQVELSRTKRKEQVEALQDLGVELVKTSKDKLAKLDLPENLRQAIAEAQRLTANGAIRRQYQYIGKLMRNVDATTIREQLDYLNGDSIKATQIFHLSEQWREKLLASDTNLAGFISVYPKCEVNELRNIVRVVRKEQSLNQNRNYTKLFRLIKSIIEDHN
jgi:ribosome-associated protein